MAAALTLAARLGLPRSGARFRIEVADSLATLAIVRLRDGEQVGAIEATADGEAVTVSTLCIGAPHRSYGAGSEAARLLIAAAAEGRFTAVRAWAPPDRGLAVYFWMRMGLRPLHGEGPGNGIWLERPLS